MKLNRSSLESILVLAVSFGLVWGVRVLFVSVVGNHWIGTLGITSGMLGMMTLLSWHGKLGWYGRIYKKTFTSKIMKKLTRYRIILAGVSLYFLGVMSLGAHIGVTHDTEQSAQLLEEVRVQSGGEISYATVITNTEEKVREDPLDYVRGFTMMAIYFVLAPFIDTHNYLVLFGMAAQAFPLFFYYVDILFIEEIEVLGVMILWGRLQRRSAVESNLT